MTNASTANSVADALVTLCRQCQFADAIDRLYAEDVVSVEPCGQRLEGIAAVREKNAWWVENFEVLENDVRGPFPHDDRFAVIFNAKVLHRPANQTMDLEQVALYTVKEGKIVRAEFFYVDEP